MPHFFEKAPILSWSSWMYRKTVGGWGAQEPTFLTPQPSELHISAMGTYPIQCKKEHVKEYSEFLNQYFSDNSGLYKVSIPIHSMYYALESEQLNGVELRDSSHKLVGVIFSWNMGIYKDKPMRSVTWFCVHPDWRRKGVGDCLLFGIVHISSPTTVFWFRNDGWLKSPAPPVWTETMMTRKIVPKRSYGIERISLEKGRDILKEAWLRQNPTGLFFDDLSVISVLTEIWKYTIAPKQIYYIILQPTFETKPEVGRGCEVLAWIALDANTNEAYAYEAILNSVTYDYVEAPARMPHTNTTWSVGGQTSWCVYGMDPGTPVTRPILSLLSN